MHDDLILTPEPTPGPTPEPASDLNPGPDPSPRHIRRTIPDPIDLGRRVARRVARHAGRRSRRAQERAVVRQVAQEAARDLARLRRDVTALHLLARDQDAALREIRRTLRRRAEVRPEAGGVPPRGAAHPRHQRVVGAAAAGLVAGLGISAAAIRVGGPA